MTQQSRPTVLVVDDTPENIDVLAGILKDDYRVKIATDGHRALKIALGDAPPDLVLLDVMMPGLSGFEVCTELKRDYRTARIPVIFVTALGEVADEARGFAAGGVDYITKPVSAPIVKARVATHLALYDQQQHLAQLVHERTAQLNHTRLQIIQTLGRAAEYKDEDTGLHVIRMSLYARELALAAGMDEEDADILLNAAPMHDIGKIGIPDAVLQKPGPLNQTEWEIMKQHPEIGARIIGDYAEDSPLLEMARVVALTHHEKWDGSGYPGGLRGTDIPLVGRIVTIADVFDALTSVRPYKDAWPVDKAIDLLRQQAGRHFDPGLTEAFAGIQSAISDIRQRYNPGLQ